MRFSKPIKRKRKESFNDYLNELFSFEELDDEEILMLKQFSVLPSIEIEFEFLQEIFGKKDDEEFDEILNDLCEKGWLSSFENGYKLHQIIKEYILSSHTLLFEEVEIIVDSFFTVMGNVFDILVAVNNKKNMIFFKSLIKVFDKLCIENEKIAEFLSRFGRICIHLGFYAKAKIYYNKALKIREKLGKGYYTSASYNNLALYYKLIENYNKAEEFYYKSLNITKNILGEKHLDIAISYDNLAGLYLSKGDYGKAEFFCNKALEIKQNILGYAHKDIASSYNNLAEIYKLMGDYKRAELFYNKVEEKLFGVEHPDTASFYNNVATLYYLTGNYAKVELLYIKSLKIREKLLGEEHLHTASSYNNLAGLYQLIEEYDKSEFLYQKALKIWIKLLGEKHSDTAKCYNNLGALFNSKGEYSKAEFYYQKALIIYKEIVGDNHPDTATCYNNLGIFYKEIKKCEKAKKYLQKTIEIVKKLEHTRISLNNLRQALKRVEKDIKRTSLRNKGRFCR